MTYRCLNKERKIYFKRGSEKAIRGITRIIFDFDGVLVRTLQSYHQAIRKVVDYYFLEILGLEEEKGKLATLGDIQRFKNTGLYNNDWNLTHAIITYYLIILMRKLQQRRVIRDFTKQFSKIQFSEGRDFIQRLGEIGEFCRCQGIGATELVIEKRGGVLSLESWLTRAKRENMFSPETVLAQNSQIGNEQLMLIKKLVPYNLEGSDLLKRLFEECYLGEELFRKFYGLASIFNFNESFLEKEEFIPKRKTLEALLSFGKFAVYSEKPRDQAMYLLEKNDFEEYFDEDGLVFYEDMVKPEKTLRMGERSAESPGLGKPNPTLFIKLVEKLTGGFGGVAYVGDDVSDALLVRNGSSQGLSNILFLGVLCSSQSPDELFSRYMKCDADAIMTDVNDIPILYADLGREV
jgi:phosphoglycolate phosphatase-like HAD superfamily hydrolase